jgi:hypothetical protein
MVTGVYKNAVADRKKGKREGIEGEGKRLKKNLLFF